MALPVDPQLLNDLPELKGVISWKVLGQVKTMQVGKRFVPEFPAEIRKLDLLDVKPPSCPFCLSVGPEYIVEVKATTPIKHSMEAVVVADRLNVLRDDPFGLYCRMTDAQLSNAVR